MTVPLRRKALTPKRRRRLLAGSVVLVYRPWCHFACPSFTTARRGKPPTRWWDRECDEEEAEREPAASRPAGGAGG